MNELIRKFAKQANSYTDSQVQISGDNHRDWMISRDEKFAELIIEECADMAESFYHHQYDFTANLELHEFIREHFGVK